jgi:hypothetical protein
MQQVLKFMIEVVSQYLKALFHTRVADPDQHGSALFLEAGSGSALKSKVGRFRGSK